MSGKISGFGKVVIGIFVFILIVAVGNIYFFLTDNDVDTESDYTTKYAYEYSAEEHSATDAPTKRPEKPTAPSVPGPSTKFHYYYDHLNSVQKQMYNILVDRVSKGELAAELKGFSIDKYYNNSTLDPVVFAIQQDRTDFFWLNGGALYDVKGQNIVVTLKTYPFWGSGGKPYQDALKAKVNEISRLAKAYPTDYEKALFVHDYIIEHTYYDRVAAAETDKPNHDAGYDWCYTPYLCLVKGRAVCDGYAEAYQMILCNLGIECFVVDGTVKSGYHAWNCVKIGGEYYYVDVTWDDTENVGGGYTFPNKATHDYFLITSAELAKDHTPKKQVPMPACNSTRYNYYRYNNYLFSSYSRSAVQSAISAQRNKKVIELKFANDAAYQSAVADISGIYDLGISDILGNNSFYIDRPEKRTLIFAANSR